MEKCANLQCKKLKKHGFIACVDHICRNTKCKFNTKSYTTDTFAFCGKCPRPKCSAEGCEEGVVKYTRMNYSYCEFHQLDEYDIGQVIEECAILTNFLEPRISMAEFLSLH
jgi:hypothetical protein